MAHGLDPDCDELHWLPAWERERSARVAPPDAAEFLGEVAIIAGDDRSAFIVSCCHYL